MASKVESNADADGATVGVYVNYLSVGHTMSEIVMEFGQVLDEAKARCQARLITSPANLRSFHELMADTINQYETEFGPLPTSDHIRKGH